MPRVGFEPTILVFEREKVVRGLDGAATVIDSVSAINIEKQERIYIGLHTLRWS
jgi:hypothetical protein